VSTTIYEIRPHVPDEICVEYTVSIRFLNSKEFLPEQVFVKHNWEKVMFYET